MFQLPHNAVTFVNSNNDRLAPLNETTNHVLPFNIVRIEACRTQWCDILSGRAERHHRAYGARGIQYDFVESPFQMSQPQHFRE